MADDRPFELQSLLTESCWEHLSDRIYRDVKVGDEVYVLPDDETYKRVAGEDMDRLILQRKSDGELFEIDADATVWGIKGG